MYSLRVCLRTYADFLYSLLIDTAYFNQNDVDMVKVFRSKQDWEKYLINSPQDTELQKVVIEELEKAKWRLKEKV